VLLRRHGTGRFLFVYLFGGAVSDATDNMALAWVFFAVSVAKEIKSSCCRFDDACSPSCPADTEQFLLKCFLPGAVFPWCNFLHDREKNFRKILRNCKARKCVISPSCPADTCGIFATSDFLPSAELAVTPRNIRDLALRAAYSRKRARACHS
jgi:hypothetical protein